MLGPLGSAPLGAIPLGLLRWGGSATAPAGPTPVLLEVELRSFLGSVGIAPVYSGLIPQDGHLPAVVLNVVTDDVDLNLDGSSGLYNSLIQFDAYGSTIEAATLTEQLRFALEDYSGPMGAMTVDNCCLDGGTSATTTFTEAGTGAATHRKMSAYQIWYYRPKPMRS